ncbi:MAG: pyruvate formate lyase-activating protein [Clostridia bacterium]|nr:pyruvate formate lyase-activating protein [Clostridia bacterium]
MCDTLRLHSFQSLGTLDGPGIRAVVFLQGCPLRCICCHNPDTWDFSGGYEVQIGELLEKISRCRPYWGKSGGVTVSGGEPLLQAKQLIKFFKALKSEGIHTALDTSGCILNDDVKELLKYTDLVLLDYKYTDADDYLKYTKMDIKKVQSFLSYLNEEKIETVLRYVFIPGINSDEESIKKLQEIKMFYSCVTSVEILPFRKLCIEKYNELGIEFPLKDTPEASKDEIVAIYEKFPDLK